MGLPFSKMHGAGNDFVLLDARRAAVALDRDMIRRMADRHLGIGFDQLLLVEPAADGTCAASYRIWNADGSSAGQCGNGARCVAAWLHREDALALTRESMLQSPSGPVRVRMETSVSVSVNMGVPTFDPQHIPFTAACQAPTYSLEIGQQFFEISALSVGNPHAVLEVDSIAAAGLEQLGPALSRYPDFVQGCNAGFAEVIDPSHIKLRVHERGAGWTLACGSGACAAVAALQVRGRVAGKVHVMLPGGTLVINWPGPGHPVWMQGPATFVFEGAWPNT